MGHDDGRAGEVLKDLLDLAAHFFAQLHVEAGKRFVEKETPGIADDRAADGDALFFAFCQLARRTVQDAVELECLRDLRHPPVDFRRRELFGVERVGEVFRHAERGVERVELEGHGHVAVARGKAVHAFAAQDHVALGRHLQPRDHPKRRGLPTTRGSEQAEHLAIADGEVDGVHGGQGAEALGQFLEFDCHYFLTVPKVTPRRSWFWRRKVTKKIGIRKSVTMAASNP